MTCDDFSLNCPSAVTFSLSIFSSIVFTCLFFKAKNILHDDFFNQRGCRRVPFCKINLVNREKVLYRSIFTQISQFWLFVFYIHCLKGKQSYNYILYTTEFKKFRKGRQNLKLEGD